MKTNKIKEEIERILGKEVIIVHKSGMKDFGRLTLIENNKKWKGTKGYKYMLEDVPYKMRSIKSIKELK